MPRELLFTQYLTLALGVTFLALSIAGLVLRARFVAGAKPVAAVVSDVGIVGRGAVTVRLRDSDGQERTARLVGASRSLGPAGTALQVLFNPERPERVVANTWRDTWGSPVTGIVVGLALVGFHVVRAGLF